MSTYFYLERPYGGTYGDVITKFYLIDSLPNFLSHGANLKHSLTLTG